MLERLISSNSKIPWAMTTGPELIASQNGPEILGSKLDKL